MTAQSASSRPRRPARAEPDDVVLARALEFTAWARTNIRLIVAGAVVVALLVGGLLYYRMYRADRMERAATEFMRLEQTVASGNTELAVRDLERYVSRYDGTTYAEEARIALAQLHLQQNRAAEAVTTLEGAADRIDDSAVGPQQALLLAAAQQAAGQTNEAIETYLAVAEEAELDLYRTEALQNAAILRSQAEDYAGAAELYARLLESAEEGSMDHQLFQMRIAEAEARAAAK